MNHEIVTGTQTALAIRPDQTEFTEEQATVLRHLGVSDNASRADAALFFHVAKRSGLDPFAKQLYMIERQGKQTIQTGIDGFRLIGHRAARASGEKISVTAPQWAHEDGAWRDLWLQSWGTPLAARITITRDDAPFTAVAMYDEYVGLKRDGSVMAMWKTRPAGMLAKCAEALAWRMAFPQDLSGLHTTDELQHDDVPSRPARRETAADLVGKTTSYDDGPSVDVTEEVSEPITDRTRKHVFALLRDLGISDAAQQRAGMSQVLGRKITTRTELTEDDGRALVIDLEARKAARTEQPETVDEPQEAQQ